MLVSLPSLTASYNRFNVILFNVFLLFSAICDPLEIIVKPLSGIIVIMQAVMA